RRRGEPRGVGDGLRSETTGLPVLPVSSEAILYFSSLSTTHGDDKGKIGNGGGGARRAAGGPAHCRPRRRSPAGEPPPGRPHGRPAQESRLRQPPGSAP